VLYGERERERERGELTISWRSFYVTLSKPLCCFEYTAAAGGVRGALGGEGQKELLQKREREKFIDNH